MKHPIIKIIEIFCLILIPLAFSTTVSANTNNEKQTNVDIEINGKSNIKNGKQYETNKPKEVGLLPQTGEVVVTFITSLIGLSLLLFVTIIYINKSYINYLRWEV